MLGEDVSDCIINLDGFEVPRERQAPASCLHEGTPLLGRHLHELACGHEVCIPATPPVATLTLPSIRSGGVPGVRYPGQVGSLNRHDINRVRGRPVDTDVLLATIIRRGAADDLISRISAWIDI